MSEKLAHVSPRKIAANRQNSLKSTGPKTPRGKAISRSNALKHGLFAMNVFVGAGAKAENREQYQQLLDQLTEAYKPFGAAEQLEVERITACWWKLGRAWRYENSEICYELVAADARMADLRSLKEPLANSPIWNEHVTIDLLKRTEAEIEATGKISDELKREMATANARFQEIWSLVEKLAQRELSDLMAQGPAQNQIVQPDSDYAKKFLLKHIGTGIYILGRRLESLTEAATQSAHDNTAVPKAEVLDRVHRADTAAERSLNQAIDRLERLQRRRLGETVPPPVSVRLTR